MAENINERKKALSSLFAEGAQAPSEAPRKFTLDAPEELEDEHSAQENMERQEREPVTRRGRRRSVDAEDAVRSPRLASIAYLEEELYWKLRAISVRSGVSVSELTSQALRKAIARYEKENGTVDATPGRRPRQSRKLF